MYAISQVASVSPATVSETPSTASEPLCATKRASPAGSAIVARRPSPSGTLAVTTPTPSTWPCTRCPPSRSPSLSERSRLTRVPDRQSPSVVSPSVSGTASTANPAGVTSSTVRQHPEHARLSPTLASRTTSRAAIQKRRPCARSSTRSTVPSSSISPVNTSALQVHDQARVVAESRPRPGRPRDRARERQVEPLAPAPAAAQHARCGVEHESLDQPGPEERASEGRPALQQHLVAALARESPRERADVHAPAGGGGPPHAHAALHELARVLLGRFLRACHDRPARERARVEPEREREPQRRVHDHAQRLRGARPRTRGEPRVVRARGSGADQDRVARGAEPVRVGACGGAGDPAR